MRRVFHIVRKDVDQHFRNRFVAVISVLSILVFALLYNLLPSRVEESLKLGLCLRAGGGAGETVVPDVERIERELEEAGKAGLGLELVRAGEPGELRGLVEREEVSAGIFIDLSAAEARVEMYVSSRAPAESVDAGEAIAREMAYTLAGYRLPADLQAVVIGPDMAGRQIPLRDKLRVLLLVLVFLLELYGLGNLVMEEMQHGTAVALLVTPVTMRDFVAAKAVTGTVIAFSQGLLMAFLLGAMSRGSWASVLALLFLGALMVVGMAFVMGAVSRNFVHMAMVSLVPLLVLMLPGVVVLEPGLASPLMKAIPTYYLVQPLGGVLNYGRGALDYAAHLAGMALFAAVFLLLGALVMGRRLA
ncbi:MAG: ABC transporter permease [Actinobacteria bacterium]|nr:ABC transporter permease [Actinomycetota bacterium]